VQFAPVPPRPLATTLYRIARAVYLVLIEIKYREALIVQTMILTENHKIHQDFQNGFYFVAQITLQRLQFAIFSH
jgi:hypothetical protein